MFTPQPVWAHEFLKGRKDPPRCGPLVAGAQLSSPATAIAVNTGPWVREWGKSVGYFTTVWQRSRRAAAGSGSTTPATS
jgi:hypothetical protein